MCAVCWGVENVAGGEQEQTPKGGRDVLAMDRIELVVKRRHGFCKRGMPEEKGEPEKTGRRKTSIGGVDV